jgi:protein-S-isoprenylcysteine O-methyltransferase Ste14
MAPPTKRGIRSRVAAPASTGAHLARTLFLAVLFWAFFFVLVPAGLYLVETRLGLGGWRFASEGARMAGAAIFFAAGVVNLRTAFALAVEGRGTPLPLDAPRELVVTGPYRYIRNPMATAALLQGGAVGVYLGSPLIVAYAAAGGVFWQLLVRPWEEADLERRHGAPYRRYRDAVRCWIPTIPAYTPGKHAVKENGEAPSD